jgi:hypothetical protein
MEFDGILEFGALSVAFVFNDALFRRGYCSDGINLISLFLHCRYEEMGERSFFTSKVLAGTLTLFRG